MHCTLQTTSVFGPNTEYPLYAKVLNYSQTSTKHFVEKQVHNRFSLKLWNSERIFLYLSSTPDVELLPTDRSSCVWDEVKRVVKSLRRCLFRIWGLLMLFSSAAQGCLYSPLSLHLSLPFSLSLYLSLFHSLCLCLVFLSVALPTLSLLLSLFVFYM